jgi:ribosomal protein L37E
MPIDLFPIPPGCLFQLTHVVRTPIVCAHRAFSTHTHRVTLCCFCLQVLRTTNWPKKTAKWHQYSLEHNRVQSSTATRRNSTLQDTQFFKRCKKNSKIAAKTTEIQSPPD